MNERVFVRERPARLLLESLAGTSPMWGAPVLHPDSLLLFFKFSEPLLPTRHRLEKNTEAPNRYFVYANLFLPQFCDLSVMGEPFATLESRPVAWKLQEEDDEKT